MKSLLELTNALQQRDASLSIFPAEDSEGAFTGWHVWLFSKFDPSFVMSTDGPNSNLLAAIQDCLEQWDEAVEEADPAEGAEA
jgi:hypothetical protein